LAQCPPTHAPPPATPALSLHDALPIYAARPPPCSTARSRPRRAGPTCSPPHPGPRTAISAPPSRRPRSRSRTASTASPPAAPPRSEEHTSELQSRFDLVCRLLLEKKTA